MIRFATDRVSPHGLQAEIVLALVMLEPLFLGFKLECVITSLTEGEHSPTTLHHKGLAVDLRSNTVPKLVKPLLLEAMRDALPPYYEVMLEDPEGPNEHFHIEYDYKGGR